MNYSSPYASSVPTPVHPPAGLPTPPKVELRVEELFLMNGQHTNHHTVVGFTEGGHAILEDFTVDGLYLLLRYGDTVCRTAPLKEDLPGEEEDPKSKRESVGGYSLASPAELPEYREDGSEEEFVLQDENHLVLGGWNEKFEYGFREEKDKFDVVNERQKLGECKALQKRIEAKRKRKREAELSNKSSVLNTPVLSHLNPTERDSSGSTLPPSTLFKVSKSIPSTIEVELWRSSKQNEGLVGKFTFSLPSEIISQQQQQPPSHSLYSSTGPQGRFPYGQTAVHRSEIFTKIVPLQMATYDLKLGVQLRFKATGLVEKFQQQLFQQMMSTPAPSLSPTAPPVMNPNPLLAALLAQYSSANLMGMSPYSSSPAPSVGTEWRSPLTPASLPNLNTADMMRMLSSRLAAGGAGAPPQYHDAMGSDPAPYPTSSSAVLGNGDSILGSASSAPVLPTPPPPYDPTNGLS